jgi:hypothetical protein
MESTKTAYTLSAEGSGSNEPYTVSTGKREREGGRQ